MRKGKAAKNPARPVVVRVDNNGQTRYLLDDEERKLRKAMTVRYPHSLTLPVVALNTEQFSLTWEAVDLESQEDQAYRDEEWQLINLLKPVLTGSKMTPETFDAIVRRMCCATYDAG